MRKFLAFGLMTFAINTLPAQMPSSGYFPPITYTTSGITTNFSTYDYLNYLYHTYQVTNVSALTHNQGIVALINNSFVNTVVFDVARGAWMTSGVGNFYGNDYVIDAGTVSWRSSTGDNGAMVYDPVLGLWPRVDFPNNPVVLERGGGTVGAYFLPTREARFTTYDPSLGSWQTLTVNAGLSAVLKVDRDFGSWRSADGTFGMAYYDRGLHQWVEKHGFATVTIDFATSNGIGAAINNHDSLKVTAYDFDEHVWVDSIFGGNGIGQYTSIAQETVYYEDSSGIRHLGYDHTTNRWIRDIYTVPHCRNFFWHPSGNADRLCHLTCNVMGAGFDHYDCGDAHTVTAPNTFKVYRASNYYLVDMVAYSIFDTLGCGEYVHIFNSTSAMAPTEQSLLGLAPNPVQRGETLHFDHQGALTAVRLSNVIGRSVAEWIVHGNTVEIVIPNSIPAGVYTVEAVPAKGGILRGKVIVH